jgi:hypothetical protein
LEGRFSGLVPTESFTFSLKKLGKRVANLGERTDEAAVEVGKSQE